MFLVEDINKRTEKEVAKLLFYLVALDVTPEQKEHHNSFLINYLKKGRLLDPSKTPETQPKISLEKAREMQTNLMIQTKLLETRIHQSNPNPFLQSKKCPLAFRTQNVCSNENRVKNSCEDSLPKRTEEISISGSGMSLAEYPKLVLNPFNDRYNFILIYSVKKFSTEYLNDGTLDLTYRGEPLFNQVLGSFTFKMIHRLFLNPKKFKEKKNFSVKSFTGDNSVPNGQDAIMVIKDARNFLKVDIVYGVNLYHIPSPNPADKTKFLKKLGEINGRLLDSIYIKGIIEGEDYYYYRTVEELYRVKVTTRGDIAPKIELAYSFERCIKIDNNSQWFGRIKSSISNQSLFLLAQGPGGCLEILILQIPEVGEEHEVLAKIKDPRSEDVKGFIWFDFIREEKENENYLETILAITADDCYCSIHYDYRSSSSQPGFLRKILIIEKYSAEAKSLRESLEVHEERLKKKAYHNHIQRVTS